MDSDGLVRSFYNMKTKQLYTNEDIQSPAWKKKWTDWCHNTPDPASCIAYENAIMATSEFAMSQLSRFNTTEDQTAKEQAHQAIQAILAVVREGRHYMPGYLPKPFGGLKRARYSHEMSVDQYTKAIAALYEWREFAPPAEQREIDQFFIDAIDFFIARKFRHSYRHRTIVTAATHLHTLGLYVALPWLAAKTSGDKSYLKHLKQFDKPLEAARTDQNLSGFNQTALVIEGFHVALKAGAQDQRLTDLIVTLWQRSSKRVDANGVGIELEKPTSQGTRIAAVATVVKQHHPNVSSPETAIGIIRQLSDVAEMTNPRVPGAIASTSISSWLLAYWRLRERGYIKS